MNNFEQRIAYEIGIKLAQEQFKKEASLGLAKNLFSAGKWGLGFGGGTGLKGSLNRTLGGATGFGVMNTLSTTGLDMDRIFSEEGARSFAGGALGGLVFSGAMPVAGKLFKGLGKGFNKTYAQTSKGMDSATQQLASKIDKRMLRIKDLEKQVAKQNRTWSGAPKDSVVAQNLNRQKELLKKNQDLYKTFLKERNDVGFLSRTMGGLQRNAPGALGTIGGIGVGLGGGMYLSGAVTQHHQDKVRSPLGTQNNVFNPVY